MGRGKVGGYNKSHAKNISLVQRFLMKDFQRFRTFGDGKLVAKNISLIQYFLIHSVRSFLDHERKSQEHTRGQQYFTGPLSSH